MVSRRARTITTGQDSWKVTRPSTCPLVPSCTGETSTVATKSSETAIRISGSTNDTITARLAPDGIRPRQRSSPSAIATPSGTVIAVASTPSHRVWASAVCRLASCQTERSGSP